MNKELREHLDKAILMLPIDQRIAFILRDVEGRSSEEAAKILKTSIPALKSRFAGHAFFFKNNCRNIWKHETEEYQKHSMQRGSKAHLRKS